MIWIGMSDAGLDQFGPATGPFRHFLHAENDSGQPGRLGLSLAYNIVKARGGEITVVTKPDGGTDLLFICRWKRIFS